jgi:hypothetical protein
MDHNGVFWTTANGSLSVDELTSKATWLRSKLAKEEELSMMGEAQPTSQRSKQTEEAKRKKKPVNEELRMPSHNKRRTTNGGVQAVITSGLSSCNKGKEDDVPVVLTRDVDMQAKDHVFCDKDVTKGKGCEKYGDKPCVWLREIENVVAVDQMEHAGTSTVNSSRRRVAYRHMFLVIYGGPGMKGVRN